MAPTGQQKTSNQSSMQMAACQQNPTRSQVKKKPYSEHRLPNQNPAMSTLTRHGRYAGPTQAAQRIKIVVSRIDTTTKVTHYFFRITKNLRSIIAKKLPKTVYYSTSCRFSSALQIAYTLPFPHPGLHPRYHSSRFPSLSLLTSTTTA